MRIFKYVFWKKISFTNLAFKQMILFVASLQHLPVVLLLIVITRVVLFVTTFSIFNLLEFEKVTPEDLEAKVNEDHCSQASEESTDQNPPHNSDPDEDKLLGLPADISIPRGHSDNSIALIIPLGDDDL